jgi:Glycosyl transferase family 11
VQTIKYYEDAIDIIGDYEYLLVFSDDIKWCRENLKFNNMIFMETLTDIEDMWIMSLCKNNIIVNSSFSWWGAWLNKNKNKKVIAPSNWFGPRANINSSDIIPEKWIKI